jgi:hypothetical protein
MFRYRLPFYFPRGLFDAEKTRHFLPPFDVGRASLYLARHAGPITEPERRHQIPRRMRRDSHHRHRS